MGELDSTRLKFLGVGRRLYKRLGIHMCCAMTAPRVTTASPNGAGQVDLRIPVTLGQSGVAADLQGPMLPPWVVPFITGLPPPMCPEPFPPRTAHFGHQLTIALQLTKGLRQKQPSVRAGGACHG